MVLYIDFCIYLSSKDFTSKGKKKGFGYFVSINEKENFLLIWLSEKRACISNKINVIVY